MSRKRVVIAGQICLQYRSNSFFDWMPSFQFGVGFAPPGDATLTGFLSTRLRERSLLEAIITAVEVGACNIEGRKMRSAVYTPGIKP